jgi:hypothetical protein
MTTGEVAYPGERIRRCTVTSVIRPWTDILWRQPVRGRAFAGGGA